MLWRYEFIETFWKVLCSILSQNDVSATGVREECIIWFSVNDFCLFDQLRVYVMHDVSEGCSKYIMSFILEYNFKQLKLYATSIEWQAILLWPWTSEQ